MIAAFLVPALIGYFLLDSTAKLLNLRNLRQEVPEEFRDIYDPARLRRSQDYTRWNTVFELVGSTVDLLALLLFWTFDGFEAVDRFVRSFHFAPVPTGLLYFAVLAIAQALLSLPFQIYKTFVIEQNFGFNRTTALTFISDRLKEWVLSAAVAGLIGWIVLTLFENWGAQAWIICWASLVALSILLVYIAPTLILPLFFKATPMPEGPLRDQVARFTERQDFPIRELLVIDGSRRSSKANAFFTGFGANKRIALFDTLVNSHTIPELLAVLAHEVGHFKKHHILRHFVFGQLNLFLLFFGASICIARPELFDTFGVKTPSFYAGMVLYLVLIQPFSALYGVVVNYISRRDEFEADRFAAESIGDPAPLITALKRLSKESLSNLTPHPLLVSLHFTHPPVLERVVALRKIRIAPS